jgi:urea transporter
VPEIIDRARRIVARHFATISETFFLYDPRVGMVGVGILAVVAPRLAIAGLLTSILARLTAERAGAARSFLETGLIELNGWFLGLACGTFFDVGWGLVAAILLGSAMVAAFSIAMQRLLATWDLPLLVAPYVPAFWILWSAFSALSWGHPAELPQVPPPPSSPVLLIVLGGLRGLGEIFFVPNAAVGLGLAAAVTIADRRLGIVMVGASIATVAVGYLAGTPGWQVEQGLAGFTAALVGAAVLRKFAGIGWVGVAVAVVTSPFLEAAAVRIAGSVGLHALSATYVGFVWTLALLRPVREASVARASWSSGVRMAPTAAANAESRPRLFESG